MINSGVILITARHPSANVNSAVNKLPTKWQPSMKTHGLGKGFILDALYALLSSLMLEMEIMVWQRSRFFRVDWEMSKWPNISSGVAPQTFLLQSCLLFDSTIYSTTTNWLIQVKILRIIINFSLSPFPQPIHQHFLGVLLPTYILNPLSDYSLQEPLSYSLSFQFST